MVRNFKEKAAILPAGLDFEPSDDAMVAITIKLMEISGIQGLTRTLVREAARAVLIVDGKRLVEEATRLERLRCSLVVKCNEEVTSTGTNRRFLQPRTDGNLIGMAYYEAIMGGPTFATTITKGG